MQAGIGATRRIAEQRQSIGDVLVGLAAKGGGRLDRHVGVIGAQAVDLVKMNLGRTVGRGQRFGMQYRELDRVRFLAFPNARYQQVAACIADRDVQDALLAKDVADDLVQDDLVLALGNEP